MAKITGRVKVTVDTEAGQTLIHSKSGVTINGLGESGVPPVERKPVFSDLGLVGNSEEQVEAFTEFTIIDTEELLLDSLAKVQGGSGSVTITALTGGKVYTLVNVTCAGNFTLTTGDGEVPVKFFGKAWTEAVQ